MKTSAFDAIADAVEAGITNEEWEKIYEATIDRLLYCEFDGEDNSSNRVICKMTVHNILFDIRDARNRQRDQSGTIVPTSQKRIHSIPVGDLEMHSAQITCPCFPTETSPGVWVHNAYDCREARERAGKNIKVSEGWINILEIFEQNHA